MRATHAPWCRRNLRSYFVLFCAKNNSFQPIIYSYENLPLSYTEIIHARANKNNWRKKKRDSTKSQSISICIWKKCLSLSLSSSSSMFGPLFFKPWSIYWFLLNVCLWAFRHFLTILHKNAMQLSIITFLFSFLILSSSLRQSYASFSQCLPPRMFAFPWNEHTILADYLKLTSVFVPYCHWSKASV